jgi:hypothetical protein
MSDAELERLCERATPVIRRSAATGAGDASRRSPAEEAGSPDAERSAAPLMVTFAGSDGRHWMVTPTTSDDATPVLRFTSIDGEVLDLDEWPDDWTRFNATQLADMARRARPSRPGGNRRDRREERPSK